MKEATVVPSHPTVWILDEGVWVTLDADEIAERLSKSDRYSLSLFADLVAETKWQVEVMISGQRFRLTWGSPEPDPPGIDR